MAKASRVLPLLRASIFCRYGLVRLVRQFLVFVVAFVLSCTVGVLFFKTFVAEPERMPPPSGAAEQGSRLDNAGSLREGKISFHRYRRPIPDVNKWEEILVNNGKGKLDPRLPKKTFIDQSEFDWDKPYAVTEEEDPLGIFRRQSDLEMDDPVLIQFLREVVLVPPSSRATYNLSKPHVEDPSEHKGTSHVLEQLLHDLVGTKTGVFFEAGVLDGETASRSLYLERYKGWTGLTVEMTWPNIHRFLGKHRKCWFAPVCLSPHPWPVKKHMRFAYNPKDPWLERTGTINKRKWDKADAGQASKREYIYTVVDCFPLYSLLLAANMTHVDFFNIDLEGVELQVLKTLPFDKLDLVIVVVEVLHTEEGRKSVQQFMIQKGYRSYAPPKVTQSQEEKNIFVSMKCSSEKNEFSGWMRAECVASFL